MTFKELWDHISNVKSIFKKEQMEEIDDINHSLKSLKELLNKLNEDQSINDSVYVYETVKYPPNDKPHDTLN